MSAEEHPKPKGRPPKDKMWDAATAEWVDDPDAPAPAPAAAGNRPKGRAPKGKMWDADNNEWVDDPDAPPPAEKKRKAPKKEKAPLPVKKKAKAAAKPKAKAAEDEGEEEDEEAEDEEEEEAPKAKKAPKKKAKKAKAPKKAEPKMELEDMKCLIRIARRLVDGASTANLKAMCAALGEEDDGAKQKLSVRVEMALRKLNFDTNTAFKPTKADIELPLEEFNTKYEDEPVIRMGALAKVLHDLSGTAAPAPKSASKPRAEPVVEATAKAAPRAAPKARS